MKVLYIGNFESQWSTEQDVKAAFEHDNHEVIAVQENKIKEYLHLIKRYDYDLLLSYRVGYVTSKLNTFLYNSPDTATLWFKNFHREFIKVNLL